MKSEHVVSALMLLLLAVLLTWPAAVQPGKWLWKPDSPASDLAVTHWPNAHFTRRMLWEEGRFPVWRPTIMSGTPFAANPLSALYYPPNWLLLFLPWLSLEAGFNLSALVHLWLAGATMYALMRHGLGTEHWGALLAAVAYQASPKLVSHLGAGHVGWAQAWAWLPLVTLCTFKTCHSSGVRQRRWALGIALSLAVQFCADVRLAAYTAIAVASLVLAWLVHRIRAAQRTLPPDSGGKGPIPIGQTAGSVALSFAVFVGLSACQWLPGLALLPDTTRSAMRFSDAAAWSLPWRYLAGLVLADHGGFQEWITYVGVSTLALAWTGARALWDDSRRRWVCVWLLALAVAAVWFSLGTKGGLFAALWRTVPALGLLRVPPRAWVLVTFAAAVLAGEGLERIGRRQDRRRAARKHWRRASVLGAAAFPPMLALGYAITIGRPPSNVIAFGLITPLAIVLTTMRLRIDDAAATRDARGVSENSATEIARRRQQARRRAVLGLAAVILVAIDLLIVDATLIEVRSSADVFADGRAAAQWLADQPGRFRVYSPSYSVPQHVAEKYELELADGVDPLQLRVYADYLTRAAGLGPVKGYGVTLPPFPRGSDVRTALEGVSPDPGLLGRLGVRYVVSAFPFESQSGSGDSLQLVHRLEDSFVYRNEEASPLVPGDREPAIKLADGTVLYTYDAWPVVAGGVVSAVTIVLAAAWAAVPPRKGRHD